MQSNNSFVESSWCIYGCLIKSYFCSFLNILDISEFQQNVIKCESKMWKGGGMTRLTKWCPGVMQALVSNRVSGILILSSPSAPQGTSLREEWKHRDLRLKPWFGLCLQGPILRQTPVLHIFHHVIIAIYVPVSPTSLRAQGQWQNLVHLVECRRWQYTRAKVENAMHASPGEAGDFGKLGILA